MIYRHFAKSTKKRLKRVGVLGVNLQLLCGVRIETALEVRMFVLLPGFSRVDVCLELLGLEGAVTISINTGCKEKSLMMEYPLSFLLEGIHSNKQTNKQTLAKYDYIFWLLRPFWTSKKFLTHLHKKDEIKLWIHSCEKMVKCKWCKNQEKKNKEKLISHECQNLQFLFSFWICTRKYLNIRMQPWY